MNTTRRAFTILEIVIVLGIIGVIVAASMVGLSRNQAKARDARRASDVARLNSGIQNYIAERTQPPTTNQYGGTCPNGRECWGGWDASSMPDATLGPQQFVSFVRPYVDAIPVDPLNNGTDTSLANGQGGHAYIYYYYISPGGWPSGSTVYRLWYKKEIDRQWTGVEQRVL